MSAAHTAPAAGLEISLRIGQRVRHHDFHGKRVTGVVRGLSVDGEDVLHADIALDEAIVIPPIDADDNELRIYRQHVPAHELAPFDDREELIAALLDVARRCERRMTGEKWHTGSPREALAPEAVLLLDLRAAIAKATGARFPDVSCSSCGQSFGPGDEGFSHCADHAHLTGSKS